MQIDTEAAAHIGVLKTAAPSTGTAGFGQADALLRAHIGRFAFLDGTELVDEDVFCVRLEDEETFPVRLEDDRVFCARLEDEERFPIRIEDDRVFCIVLEDDEEAAIK